MGQKQNYQWKVKTMGTDYYPEHWDRSLWDSDLDRMKEAGISMIRIAEFSWSKVEPREGEFTYAFFDEFLDLCEQKGMKVIFGTPSATPPAWLTVKYPEVLNCTIDGVKYRHGSRRHYDYNSPKYQELVSRIVEKEASHYGPHPAVVGWQIDNELNCETADFYSEADSIAFRKFLQEKYGTLENLNRAWGTDFWNEGYTAWDEIRVIQPSVSNGINPHQHLDYIRFVSDSCLRFAQMQADIIRKYVKPGDFITTNGMFGHLDNHRMENDILDVYTYDSYPNFAQSIGTPEGDNAAVGAGVSLGDRDWSKNLSEVRSICPHFGIMEQQAGPGGWTTRMEQASPRPGQLTLWAMQSVAHGADYIGFFRWRTSVIGTEIYWHGILDYDNRDNRRLAEVKDFYHKLRTLDAAAGADYKAAFGILKDYDNVYDAEVDHWHGRVASVSESAIYAASQLHHTPCSYVYLTENTTLEDLTPYPVLFYPHPVILEETRAELLKAYVARGGNLIIGCRSGYKDPEGHCVMQPQPGLLAEVTGDDVTDWSFACPGEDPIAARFEDGQVLELPVFNDVLHAHEGTKILASYENGYFRGAAAATEHVYGKGRAVHLGSTFTAENTAWLLQHFGILEPFRDVVTAPAEIETAVQEKGGRQYLFLLNYSRKEAGFLLKKPARLLYTGEMQEGSHILPAFGTAVYELS